MSEFWYAMIFVWFVLPLMFLWGFCLVDVFSRKDIGWSKIVWAMAIVFFPLIGMLVYFIARPKDADPYGQQQAYTSGYGASFDSDYRGSQTSGAVREMETLTQMHDAGTLTDEEFERAKTKILAA